MFTTPTLSISCITCMRGEEGSSVNELSGRGGGKNNSSVRTSELYGGLTGGSPWDDGIYDGVREITLVYGQCIDSISVAYDKDGQFAKPGKHGGVGGGHLHKPLTTVEVKLEYPEEFLVGVSGNSCSIPGMAPEVLRSLKLESNRRSFGPFGLLVGNPFSFRVQDGEQIVGLMGRNGWYLDAIGFHISPAPKSKLFRTVQQSSIPSELYGGVAGGGPWDDGVYDGVREITLVYGQCIDSISVAYDKDGQFVKPGKHGGVGGGHLHKPLTTVEVKLEYPEEFLVGVSGNSCSVPGMAAEVLRSLKLESNRRSFGPFGVLVGNPFSFRVQDGEQIVGLMGRNGWYLDAIGFHISPAPKSKLFRRVQQSSIPSELYGGVAGGGPWDDGVYDGVREITLVFGQCIDSICVAYDMNGKLVKTGKHGGYGGNHLHKNLSTVEIKLEYPSEFLVSISGYSSSVPGMAPEVLRSLKFETNKRSYGPFGVEIGTPFTFRVKDGEKIVGLKGRNGWYLDAVGFHISYAHKRKRFLIIRKYLSKVLEC